MKVTLYDEILAAPAVHLDFVALDHALQELARLDSQQVQIIEMKFFAGLSIEETVEALYVSPARVKRDWATARAWLYREMTSK